MPTPQTVLGSEPHAASDDLSLPVTYQAKEYGEVAVDLAKLLVNGRLDIYSEVLRKNYFNIRLHGSELVFTAGHWIGLIPINDRVMIDVRPRVPVRTLARLLAISNEAPTAVERLLRRYLLTSAETPFLLDLYATSLLKALEPLQTGGLYRRYERVQQDTSYPRGRILLGETIRRHHARGRKDRVAVRVFDHRVDHGLNRLLKTALSTLGRQLDSPPSRRGRLPLLARLEQAFLMFSNVALDLKCVCLDDPMVRNPEIIPASRSYYVPAVHIAKMILGRFGLELEGEFGNVELPSILVDLEAVFEAYIRAVLLRDLAHLEPPVSVLDGKKGGAFGGKKELFDESPSEPVTPDVVLRRVDAASGQKTFPQIVEIKYRDRDFTGDDVYQALAYAASYRSPVVLVRPRLPGEQQKQWHIGKIAGLRIDGYAFDLAAEEGLVEEQAFSDHIARRLPGV